MIFPCTSNYRILLSISVVYPSKIRRYMSHLISSLGLPFPLFPFPMWFKTIFAVLSSYIIKNSRVMSINIRSCIVILTVKYCGQSWNAYWNRYVYSNPAREAVIHSLSIKSRERIPTVQDLAKKIEMLSKWRHCPSDEWVYFSHSLLQSIMRIPYNPNVTYLLASTGHTASLLPLM